MIIGGSGIEEIITCEIYEVEFRGHELFDIIFDSGLRVSGGAEISDVVLFKEYGEDGV